MKIKINCFHFIGIFISLIFLAERCLSIILIPQQESEKYTVFSNPKIPRPENGLKIRIVFKEDLSIGKHRLIGKILLENEAITLQQVDEVLKSMGICENNV